MGSDERIDSGFRGIRDKRERQMRDGLLTDFYEARIGMQERIPQARGGVGPDMSAGVYHGHHPSSPF